MHSHVYDKTPTYYHTQLIELKLAIDVESIEWTIPTKTTHTKPNFTINFNMQNLLKMFFSSVYFFFLENEFVIMIIKWHQQQ